VTKFIHLNVHTEYSISDGLITIQGLIDQCKRNNMPSVAITEQGNLFSLVKFYQAAMRNGIKPIIGADLWVTEDDTYTLIYQVTVLCQNSHGFKNLSELITQSYISGQHKGVAYVNQKHLLDKNAGLILLAKPLQNDLYRIFNSSNNKNDILDKLQLWQVNFADRFYLSLLRVGHIEEERYNKFILELAKEFNLPVVAVNNCCFLKAIDYEAHEARVCIHEADTLDNPNRSKKYTTEQYFKASLEMHELFADVPSAITNTEHIAKRCNLHLELDKIFLPQYSVPKQHTTESYLSILAKQGLEKRLSDKPDRDKQVYVNRLAVELEVINNMGFAGYFLIVADIIQWAVNNGVPVGPGRGSGAGSLVAYVLEITGVDPLDYDLLFERFLNPERISMPDFDIDFCMEGRDRVIDYVVAKYGKDSVAQIITYGTMAAKAVIRDVGRVLGHPYVFVDHIAKLIPLELGMTLDKALEQEVSLSQRYKNEEEVRYLINLAKKLEGVTRNVGKHAGGLVIAPSKLTDFTPLYCEDNGCSLVTQLDKDDVEAIGLVKFDFLGLRTLTIINWATININQIILAHNGLAIDINKIPLDDQKTFSLLCACNTTAVFQLESRGMKDLIKRLQPSRFEDIIALVALFRPGPLQSGMVDDFINRKLGRAEISYAHPALEKILQPTYGVILYQEQVMQIAQTLAGYSLGAADLLRRAMGKKKAEEMELQRSIFVQGALTNNIQENVATYIFDLMEKFSGYGFNKSHAAVYALVSYQTAWLKTYYPEYFMAAVLSADLNNTDKIVIFIEDCARQNIVVLPPDINRGEYKFIVDANHCIIYGLGAIKGIGEAAIESILEARAQGKFIDLFDLCLRVDKKKLSRRAVEALIKSGALDSFTTNRAQLMANLELAILASVQLGKASQNGQLDLFGTKLTEQDVLSHTTSIEVATWNEQTRLIHEKETLGLYLSGHPINEHNRELAKFISCPLGSLVVEKKANRTIAGIITEMRSIQTKKGDRMLFIAIDDKTARQEVAIFGDLWLKNKELIQKDALIVVEAEIARDDYTGGYKARAINIYDLDAARQKHIQQIKITILKDNLSTDLIENLQNTLGKYAHGSCPVVFIYQTEDAQVKIRLGQDWIINPLTELLQTLQQEKNLLVDLIY
jgi:DNA polymerase-3 subunit alpha